jgi:hypothetical protein
MWRDYPGIFEEFSRTNQKRNAGGDSGASMAKARWNIYEAFWGEIS